MFRPCKRSLLSVVLLLAAAFAIDSAPLGAQRRGGPPQPASSGPFGALHWRSLGPERGGRSLAVAGSTARPFEVLLWRNRRRIVEDDRRRHDVEAGDRRSDHELVGWRCRRRSVQSRHRLHRHRRGGYPRQHHSGRRRVQVDRRRKDLDEDRSRRDAEHLAGSASIRRTRISCTSPRSGITRRRIPIAASSARKTAARRGKRFCSATTRPARSMLVLDPNNPHVLYAALWEAFRNCAHDVERRARAAACSSRPTAAITGPRSRATPACRKGCSARSASRSRAPIPTGCTRRSKRRTADSSRPTMPARPGSS